MSEVRNGNKHAARAQILNAVTLAALAVGGTQANAQPYPTKPVRLVVPYAAGGGADIVARVLSPVVGKRLGQQLVVDNRAGAAGTIGAALVAKAPPDGYTLLVVTVPFAISATLFDKLSYDPIRDFAPVTFLAKTPNVLTVHPSLPVKSVKGLIELARANPGKINYAAPIGTVIQLSAELFKMMAKVEMTHITYNGTAPSVIAILSGESSVMFAPAISVLPHFGSGKLRPLAVTSSQRAPALADIPTIAESGLPGFDMVTWYGIFAPAGTPEDVIARLNGDFAKSVETPDISNRFIKEASVPVSSTPAEFGIYVKDEIAKIGKLVKSSGAQLN